ncbi:MAG: alpha/beta hydrolase [Bacteriovoracaceae bacterium]|nr:alpha/beta hydrolase [Bacteroidota bacterium]
MKKAVIFGITLLLLSVGGFVLGQTKLFPFEVTKTGFGKQTIIFIPGLASSGDVWNETKSKYEKDYTCYSLTMAGFAEVKPQPNATFNSWKIAIANFITENKIENPILIGHSLGGGLALAVASNYPELIGKIIVVDALPCLAAMMNPAFKAKNNIDCSEIVQQMSSASEEQFYQMQKLTISHLVADTSKQKEVLRWSLTSDRQTVARMYCDFSNTDLREQINTITCPSLILLESYFKNMQPSIQEQYRNLQTAEIKYADKGLHFIMYDDTEWYLNQIDYFLKVH